MQVSPDRLSPGDFFQRLRLHVSSRHPDGKSGVKGGGGEAICDIKRYPVTLNDARSALSTCVVTCELTVVVRRDDGKRLVLLFVDEIARSKSPPPPPLPSHSSSCRACSCLRTYYLFSSANIAGACARFLLMLSASVLSKMVIRFRGIERIRFHLVLRGEAAFG